MNILALDTSTDFLSVACLKEGKVLSCFHREAGIRHNEILMSVIDQTTREVGWEPADIELVCIGLGPGSFTGLRIGVATVKGLAACLSLKVKGVPTMDAMIRRVVGRRGLFAPFLDAHKGKVYTCIYSIDETGKISRKTEYLLVTAEEILCRIKDEVFFFGSGIIKYGDKLRTHPSAGIIEDIDWHPRAEDIGVIGGDLLRDGEDAPDVIEPMYLYPGECNITKGIK
jgi:tRNA threonylcarbamoyladenosine biosynthesis protein TsaB